MSALRSRAVASGLRRLQASSRRGAGLAVCVATLACGDGESPMEMQEPEDPCVASVEIGLGQSTNGTLATTDCQLPSGGYGDRFSLVLSSATDVRIDLRSSAFDAFLELQTPGGAVIATNDDAGSLDSRIVRNLQAGSYIIVARSLGPGQTGGYNLTVVLGPDCSTVGELMLGQLETGALETSDCVFDFGGFMDNWSLALGSVQKVRVELQSAAFDEIVLVRDEQGQILNGADWTGPTGFARLEMQLPAGQWTISVTSLSETQLGGYDLTVDVAPPCTPGTEISFGTPVPGELSATDCLLEGVFTADSFAVSIEPATPIVVQLKSADFSPLVVLRDETGADVEFAFDDDEDGIAWINAVLEAGSYALFALSGSEAEGRGSYTLTVSEPVCSAPAPVAHGETVNGSLGPTDCLRANGAFQESWELVLASESPTRIDLLSEDFDAFLELRDDQGALIEANDDGGGDLNARIDRTLQAGTYEIVVSSFAANQAGDYELTVGDPPASPSPVASAPTTGSAPKHPKKR